MTVPATIQYHASVPDFMRRADLLTTTADLAEAFASKAFPRIGTKDNRFWVVTQDGTQMPVNQLDAGGSFFLDIVVIASNPVITKNWYEKPYQAESTEAPDCFSVDGIVPDPSSPVPQTQHCAGCPQNAFGSHPNGSGKACQDSKRIAVLLASDTPVVKEGMAEIVPAGQTVYGYKIPPMTGKNLSVQAKLLKSHGAVMMGVKLRARFVSQGVVDFAPLGYVTPEFFAQAERQAATEAVKLACGIVEPRLVALPPPPAYAHLQAPAPSQATAVPFVGGLPVSSAASPPPLLSPPPAPTAAAPASAPQATFPPTGAAAGVETKRRRGRPAAAAPAAGPTPAPATPVQAAASPADAGMFFGHNAPAQPPAASAQVIQTPQATSPQLDAALAAIMAQPPAVFPPG